MKIERAVPQQPRTPAYIVDSLVGAFTGWDAYEEAVNQNGNAR